jgi:hypothetical protein
VIGFSRTRIAAAPVAAIEGIGEDGTVGTSRHEIDRNVTTVIGPGEVIDRIASIVPTKSNAPIALRKAIAWSDRTDSTDRIVPIIPAAGAIADSWVPFLPHETRKEWIFLA